MKTTSFDPVSIRTRQVPVEIEYTALISVDMQNGDCGPELREKARKGEVKAPQSVEFFEALADQVLPNQVRLHAKARELGIENIYVIIESLTRDGRDRGIDHKVSDIHWAPGSYEARIIDEVAPADNDIIIRKTASGPFGSTNLDYVLRNLGIRYLIVFGVITDQCVENTVRVAADLGYLVTVVSDACATYTAGRHSTALAAMKGYARVMTTAQVLEDLEGSR